MRIKSAPASRSCSRYGRLQFPGVCLCINVRSIRVLLKLDPVQMRGVRCGQRQEARARGRGGRETPETAPQAGLAAALKPQPQPQPRLRPNARLAAAISAAIQDVPRAAPTLRCGRAESFASVGPSFHILSEDTCTKGSAVNDRCILGRRLVYAYGQRRANALVRHSK